MNWVDWASYGNRQTEIHVFDFHGWPLCTRDGTSPYQPRQHTRRQSGPVVFHP